MSEYTDGMTNENWQDVSVYICFHTIMLVKSIYYVMQIDERRRLISNAKESVTTKEESLL